MPVLLELRPAPSPASPRHDSSPDGRQRTLRDVMREVSSRALSGDSTSFVERLDPKRGE